MEELLQAKLIKKIKRTEDTMSFRFMPEKPINFLPGQFLQVIFDKDNMTNQELNKYLSFSSSPTKDYFEITKRISKSMFSEELRSLSLSDEVIFRAPFGNCVFKEDYTKIAFLIGGIGITPVISIIEYIVEKNLDTNIVLIYSNHTEDIAFREALDKWQELKDKIKIFYVITDSKPQDKKLIEGHIDKDLLKEKVIDFEERMFFVFGPPSMVEGIKRLYKEAFYIKENLRTESFTGY